MKVKGEEKKAIHYLTRALQINQEEDLYHLKNVNIYLNLYILYEQTGYSKDSRLKCIEKALNIKQQNGLGDDLQAA